MLHSFFLQVFYVCMCSHFMCSMLMHCFMHFNSLLNAHRLSFVFAPIRFTFLPLSSRHTHTHTKIHSNSFPGHSPKNSMENLDFSFVLPSLTFSFLLSLCSFYHNNFDRKKRLPFFINVNHFFFSVLTSYI